MTNKFNKNDKNGNRQEQLGWQLAEALADIDPQLVSEAGQARGQAAAGRNWYKGLAAALALALVFSCSSLAWAVNSLQQEQQARREFYLRYLTPGELEHIDWDTVPGRQRGRQLAEMWFEDLGSDDMYKQYIAINQLVEVYNDPALRKRAVAALQPFLDNPEPKLAEAAAFALDILEQRFESDKLYRMADGSIMFTLFNDYSDYGTYNAIWQFKDGLVKLYTGFMEPLMYIEGIYPSPDGQLLAVCLCSNKSNFVVILDVINGYRSEDLLSSSRVRWALQLARLGDAERFPEIRSDHETYSGYGDLQWLDNETVSFDAALSYNYMDIIDYVQVTFNYNTKDYSIVDIEQEE